ncbi:MAG: exosortase/archaeosortase family protein [Deltaproteobacteria bacterium]|nr:exosortase/archaeosortase family protein [Deltaproteobacteria bacterium]
MQLSLLGFGLLVLYAPVFPELWRDWNQDPNYGYGIFVPLISAFLVWRKRKKISRIQPEPYGPGLFVVLFGFTTYLIGIAGNELFTTRISFIIVLLGILLTMWGKKGSKTIVFPILYLLLMIPLPYILYYAIASPMKLFATKWAVFTIDLLHITVHHEGNIIYLPNTTLEVADACSGLRSLTSLLTFGIAFTYIAQQRFLPRALLVVAIFPIAVISNILRLVVTALLAVYKGPDTAQGFLHETSGIVVYTTATLLIFGVNELLQAFHRRPAHPEQVKPS